MKKVVLIPDSFKGTMSSTDICAHMKQVILQYYPEAQVIGVPVADGGEGSVEAFLQAMGGEKITVPVKGPYFEEMDAFYGLLPGNVAIIEMAAAAGLPLVGENRAAEKTTTYGVGQLMKHAIAHGCEKIILGLGGSATNDGGCGAACAMGAVFTDKDGVSFVPTGEGLSRIAHIDLSKLQETLGDIPVVTMCDIDNPLCGINGASHIFGPQKGADPETVELLDAGLAHMAEVVKTQLGKDVLMLEGAGAAGGMGGGTVAYFGATLQMGIETVLETVGFDALAKDADLVFTGEGKIDSQSLRGKVVIGVARRTKKMGLPLIAVVGAIDDDISGVYDEGVTAVMSINRQAMPFSESRFLTDKNLTLTMDTIMRMMKNIKGM